MRQIWKKNWLSLFLKNYFEKDQKWGKLFGPVKEGKKPGSSQSAIAMSHGNECPAPDP
jgi:hypothetical protein